MPRVLVIGATGFLGQTVAQALLRTGQHTVYGLCRSSTKAATLSAQEIIPVVCANPADQPQPYLEAIRNNRVNVVIDCTAAYGDSAKFLAAVESVGKERLESFATEGISNGPKIGYIYTSGAWVHGDSEAHVTDVDPVGTDSAWAKALDIVGWRPSLERQVLAARNVLDVMIFRPAQMYGRSSAAWGPIFAPIAAAVTEGKTEVQLTIAPTSQSPVIHVDDVADAICRGVAKMELLSGTSVYPIFDLVSTTENIRDILDAFADALISARDRGGKKLRLELVGPGDDVYMKALGSTVKYSSARARQLLDWEPRRNGLISGMDVYARAWQASQ